MVSVRYDDIYQVMKLKHLLFHTIHYCLFCGVAKHIYSNIFSLVSSLAINQDEAEPGSSKQKDQPKQIEDVIPKPGAPPVGWTLFGYDKSYTD